MRILAIDYGQKRTGIAVTDPLQLIANGLTTVATKDLEAFVLDYVRRIADYATDSWQGGIDGLWQQIVESACFRDCLALKKGLRAGHMNRYTVTNIVCRLQGKGVYRRDVPMLTLHLQLEGTTKRNRYYTSCGNYDLTREAKGVLRELLVRV